MQRSPSGRSKVPIALVTLVTLFLVAVVSAGVWFAFLAPYQIDERTFPDAGVRAAAAACDANGDGVLSREEARAVTRLEVSNAGEVEGLGAVFPNLDCLSVSGDDAVVDVSDLGVLVTLSIETSRSQTVDLSRNPKLAELSLSNEVQVTGLEAANLEEVWLVSGATESYDANPTITYSAQYDSLGRATSTFMEAPLEGVSSLSEYTYDDAGRVASVSETFSGRSGTDTQRLFVFGYDDEGRVVSREDELTNFGQYLSYDEEGRLAWCGWGGIDDVSLNVYYTYNDQGLLESSSSAYKADDPSVFQFEYDSEGRCVKKTDYVGEDWEFSTGYELDGQGRVTRAYCSNGDYAYPVSFSYDEQGRIVSVEAQMGEGVETATLTYDEQGRLELAQVTSPVEGRQRETDYEVAYTRRFLSRAREQGASGVRLELGVPASPLVMAQHMSLVDVFSVPNLVPDPTPYLYPGDSMTPLF